MKWHEVPKDGQDKKRVGRPLEEQKMITRIDPL
jgi:hypothetical protein